MQRRIPRSALVVSCVAALAAFAAGSAQAAITAVTGPVASVSADTATVTGTITTGGANVQWEFAYNLANNLFVGGYSTGGVIGVGATAPTPIVDNITNLTPNTAYTYELVATDVTYGSAYYLNTPVYGAPPLTFTTKGPGKASLASTKLTVKKRRVLVGITCSAALKCDGGVLAITARHKGKKVACGSATFDAPADETTEITTSRVSAKCAALLALAPKHKIKAHLTAGFTYQKGISKGVTLIAAK